MIIKRISQAVSITGLAALMIVGTARAATITYTTNAPGTAFAAGNIGPNALTLDSTSGQAATLLFTPNVSSISGYPSNIDYGDFFLSCASCSALQTTIFGAFTFDLVISDTTDNGTGEFVGTSTGGTVSSNSSTITISWVPLQLGPGTNNASYGSFGPTAFGNSGTTAIVAPNSGDPGNTTVQGTITSSIGAAPEPTTFALFGAD